MGTRQPSRSIATHAVGSCNVYRDLGFHDADEMLAKAELISTLSELIAKSSWSVPDAAARLNYSREKLPAILRGQFREISVGELAGPLPVSKRPA
jgi:hypothetical protein